MVPSAFVLMDSLPLSPNGKVDRAALPAPEVMQGSLVETPSSPQTEIEQKIASVWQRVLGLKQVSVEDNFFDVGGDSLQLLEAHAELQKTLSPDLVITDLFEYPTVRTLAKHVGGAKSSSGITDAQERARKQQQVWSRQKPSRVSQIS
jgi:acyl carrier protein